MYTVPESTAVVQNSHNSQRYPEGNCNMWSTRCMFWDQKNSNRPVDK